MESQDIGNEEHGAVKRSIMNLVDLAGSERPGAVDLNTNLFLYFYELLTLVESSTLGDQSN